jgi:Mn-dependent DtxR family transcriptional regulator/predicted phosphodiesterase
MTDLTDAQREYLDALPQPSYSAWADALGRAKSSVGEVAQRLVEKGVVEKRDGQWVQIETVGTEAEADADTDDETDEEADADLPALDDNQRAVIAALPATTEELSATLNCDPDAALAALDRLRDDGITVRYDAGSSKHILADERSQQLRSQSHLSLSAKTKRAKAHLREEQALLDRLPSTDPLSIGDWDPDPEKETMLAAISDLHFGDVVTDDRGRTVYDADTAHEAADRFAEKVIQNARQWGAEFDECVLAILGDVATGTEIYKTQKNDIGDLLSQQIRDGSQALTRIATTLREHFEVLRIRAVVGNHGFQSPSAARGSNTDLTCYYWMQDALRREGYDDVDILIAEQTHHLNFEIRGWDVHIRHGQDSQQQVDETARSEADWRGWRDKHQFDIALRGHHHVPSLHWVLNRYPVVTTPSPKPGGEFADRIGDPDASAPADAHTERKLGYCLGVSNERRITDSRMTDAG